MKSVLAVASVLSFVTIAAEAQSPPGTNQSVRQIELGTYSVVGRGPHERVWERTDYETTPDGSRVPRVHRYKELATGMHFLNASNQWQETQELIQLAPDGSAAATNGPHRLYAPADIYEGVLQVVGPDGRSQRSRPMGIAYVQGSNSVLIAELTNCVGQLLPSGNQVLYQNAFSGIRCDLLVTYRKSGIECDLIFKERPAADPSAYGLSPALTQIQLLTEFFDTVPPARTNVTVDALTGVEDSDLAFGSMRMRRGKAFFVGSNSTTNSPGRPANGIPVRRSWQVLENRSFLIESVPYKDLAPKLAELAKTEPGAKSALIAQHDLRKVASGKRALARPHYVRRSNKRMELASVSRQADPGVVLDYEQISGTAPQNPYVFRQDTTYFVSGTFFVQDAVLEGGTVIKLNSSGQISISGSVDCQTGPYKMALFSSVNCASDHIVREI